MFHKIVLILLPLTLSLPAAPRVEKLLRNPDTWFQGAAGRQALESILSWQTSHGDWPKNRDTSAESYSGDRSKLRGTFDNGATTAELRILTKAFHATKERRYEKAFLKGLDHILRAQYPHGGFPQSFPLPQTEARPGKWYVEGNFFEGQPDITADNWRGMRNSDRKEASSLARVLTPFEAWPVNQQSAREAYESVLTQAGATLPRRDAESGRRERGVKEMGSVFVEPPTGLIIHPSTPSPFLPPRVSP